MPQLPMNPMNMNVANAQPGLPRNYTQNLNQNKGFGTKLKEFFVGGPDQLQQFGQFGPEQQQALNQLLGMGLGGLQKTPFDFQPIADQARTNFAQKTIPSIAERFTALGGQRSSAFNQALGSAGSGLETDLAAMGSQYNLGQQSNLLALLGLGLQPQYQTAFQPGGYGVLGGLLGGLGQGLGRRV